MWKKMVQKKKESMKLIVALIIVLIGFFSVTYATSPTALVVTDLDNVMDITEQQNSQLSSPSRRGERLITTDSSTIAVITSPSQNEVSFFDMVFAHLSIEERRALAEQLEVYSQMSPEQAFQTRINQLNNQQSDSGERE